MASKPDGQNQSPERSLLIATSEALNVAMLSIDSLAGQVQALITINSALLRTHPDALKLADLMKFAHDRMTAAKADEAVLRGHEKAVYLLLDDDGPLSNLRKHAGLPDGEPLKRVS
jgi:hypothetical protein